MVKSLTTFIYIYLFLFPNIVIANEKNFILNPTNKNILRKYFDEIDLIGEANYTYLFSSNYH